MFFAGRQNPDATQDAGAFSDHNGGISMARAAYTLPQHEQPG